MKRRSFLSILLLGTMAGASSLLTGCMSPEQLAETAKRLKERKAELDEKNPQVPAVFTKKNISKGTLISDDDIEERTVGALESHMPPDAIHNKHQALLQKAKTDLQSGQMICQHDLEPLLPR